MVLGFVIAAQH